ncbi:glutamine synthetase [Zopfia rhizophila CBS 207.26]|uniref:Glutamine synthetase n=1 Tax=Zopfia rhizophila CBS 207.26 TaxID=1314779 RepID=A0A6A6DAY5_9PEZI|nr:glutamine synthetase [Zopfia rhizophila CBS 207.26]
MDALPIAPYIPQHVKELLNVSIKLIRFQYIDYSGILRCRVLTASFCLEQDQNVKFVGTGPAALYASYVEGTDTTPVAAACRLVPDWSSFRVCTYAARHASVMCRIYETLNSFGFRRCPRTCLYKVLEIAEKELRCTFLGGYEIEVVFMDVTKSPPTPFKNVVEWSLMEGLRGRPIEILEQIAESLEAANISVQQLHTEGSQGLFEITTGPLRLMEATDALVYTHETIKTICDKHGLVATCFPKPSAAKGLVGQHLHLSISSLENDPIEARTVDAYIAGILSHLRAICAFTLPSHDSYTRVQDRRGTNGTWVTWGTEFRDVPLRKIESTHWEIRCMDGTANVYLAVAALIAAGIDGIRSGRKLSWGDSQKSPSLMTDSAREELGIKTRLPLSLKEALGAIKTDLTLSSTMSQSLVEKYIKIKTEEAESLEKMSPEERTELGIKYF